MQFIDEVRIFVKAGNGGNGIVSFRREANVPNGGPDGGNGGKGGDVIVKANPNLSTLIDFRFQQHYYAKSGRHGQGKLCAGAKGENKIIYMPVGTQIFTEDGELMIADVKDINSEFVIACGGHGGVGNHHFRSSINQAPRQQTNGEVGEEKICLLKLKLFSDIGLVGLPNAGKSSFLSVTTAAKPKIADYPFTTLKPQLGVAYLDSSEIVIADIPGLIKGAHQGVGIGDRFLKHIERCRAILHLIDISADDIIENYHTIRNELELYGNLADKEEIIVLNKSDLIIDQQELEEKISKLRQVSGKEIIAISSITQDNLSLVMRKIFDMVKDIKSLEKQDCDDEPYDPLHNNNKRYLRLS